MAFAPETPSTIEVDGPKVSKELTHFHIHSLHIALNPNNAQQAAIKVQFSKGYMNGDAYVVVETESALLQGPALLEAMQTATTGGTLYDEVRKAVWALLMAGGHIPAGAAV